MGDPQFSTYPENPPEHCVLKLEGNEATEKYEKRKKKKETFEVL